MSNAERGLDNVPLRSNTGIPAGRLATWFLIFGELVIFGGLLVSYMLTRLAHPDWNTPDNTGALETGIGAFNTVLLLTSDLFVVMAHGAAQKKDGAGAFKFIMLTVALGLLFLCIKAYEYAEHIHHGQTIGKNLYWSYYYLITGLHGTHIVVGALALFIVGLDAKKGIHFQRVEVAGLYWHLVDMVWLLVFPLLYLAK